MREQTLPTAVLTELRKQLPFTLVGFDTKNDTVFVNKTRKPTAIRPASSSRAAGPT